MTLTSRYLTRIAAVLGTDPTRAVEQINDYHNNAAAFLGVADYGARLAIFRTEIKAAFAATGITDQDAVDDAARAAYYVAGGRIAAAPEVVKSIARGIAAWAWIVREVAAERAETTNLYNVFNLPAQHR